ncbi:hypothetical protein JCM18920_2413 [Cutibacterium acnes JCM 18920]|nr:hypothetical protein JCM18920_2413 [Cutibacterium acnes JCM 18920]
MAESTVILAAICGALLACAPVFVISGRRNAPLRLSDAWRDCPIMDVKTPSSISPRRADGWSGGEREQQSVGRGW